MNDKRLKIDKPPALNRAKRWAGLVAVLLVAGFLVTGLPLETAVAEEQKPPGLSSKFSRRLQGIFGLNAMSSWIGAKVLEREIRKKVKGNLDVDLKPYSAMDLTKGKARQMTITGDNLLYDETFYVASFNLKTDKRTPLWVDMDSGKLKQPVMADVVIRIRDEDMRRSLETPAMQKQLSNVKMPLIGKAKQNMQFVGSEVRFLPKRVRVKTNLGVVGAAPDQFIPLEMETGLEPEPEKGRVRFKDIQVAPIPGMPESAHVESFLETLLQWFLKPTKLNPVKEGEFRVKSIDIAQGDILLKGRMELKPD